MCSQVVQIRLPLPNENDYYEDMLFNSRCAVFLTAVIVVAAAVPVHAFPSLGLQANIVTDTPEPGSVALVQNKRAVTIFVDKGDWTGVLPVASDLQADVERVSGVKKELVSERRPSGGIGRYRRNSRQERQR